MRASSAAIDWFISTTSLKACAISPSMPIMSSGIRTAKSPFFSARNAAQQRPVLDCLRARCRSFIEPPLPHAGMPATRPGCEKTPAS